jgi:molybdopterin converting factor small subunit
MRVVLPSQLHSYTAGRREVAARGATLGEVLEDLERQFPGIRFRVIDEQGRVRQHIVIFVGSARRDELDAPLAPDSVVQIVGALSGG